MIRSITFYLELNSIFLHILLHFPFKYTNFAYSSSLKINLIKSLNQHQLILLNQHTIYRQINHEKLLFNLFVDL